MVSLLSCPFAQHPNPLIVTEEQLKGFADMIAAFQVYAPNFTGPISPEESVQRVMSVVYKASIESGSGGQFVSHFGTKQWL